jgi:hypothetical protein
VRCCSNVIDDFVMNLDTGDQTTLEGHSLDPANRIYFSADGTRLAALGTSKQKTPKGSAPINTIKNWELSERKTIMVIEDFPYQGTVLAVSPDGAAQLVAADVMKGPLVRPDK